MWIVFTIIGQDGINLVKLGGIYVQVHVCMYEIPPPWAECDTVNF